MISFEYREEKNILIAVMSNPYDPAKDTMASMQEITKRLEGNNKDLHYVADMSQLDVSFADLVQGLAQAFRTPGNVFANPRLKTYTVGSHELVQLGAKAAAEQEQYGNVPIQLFTSVEAAIQAANNA